MKASEKPESSSSAKALPEVARDVLLAEVSAVQALADRLDARFVLRQAPERRGQKPGPATGLALKL